MELTFARDQVVIGLLIDPRFSMPLPVNAIVLKVNRNNVTRQLVGARANDMEIVKISEDKEKYIPLLLVGDEEEPMIMRYLLRGELFVMREGETALCAAVVTDEGGHQDVCLLTLAAGDAYLTVQEGDINLDYQGTPVTVQVESNTTWTVE